MTLRGSVSRSCQVGQRLNLANGKVVILTVSMQPVIADAEAELQSMLEQITQYPRTAETIARATAPRVTATVVDEENGDRGVWDVAIPRRTAGT